MIDRPDEVPLFDRETGPQTTQWQGLIFLPCHQEWSRSGQLLC